MGQWEPVVALLKVVDRTPATPGLPYIAALGSDADLMFSVVAAAIAALPAADRTTLRLKGLVRIDPDAYLALPIPPSPADLGMPG